MALAALGLSGCAPKTPAASTGDAAPAFTPGTYEATVQGRNGEIKVSVTFEPDRIASIEADHMESRNIGDAAVRLLTDNYLDTQKLSVDTVTGATLTSMAFATDNMIFPSIMAPHLPLLSAYWLRYSLSRTIREN